MNRLTKSARLCGKPSNSCAMVVIRMTSKIATRCRVVTGVASRETLAPSPCASSIQRAFEQSAENLGLSHMRLESGAGHDTMALAQICPAGMIFVPSTGGSHSPREHCAFKDCVNGANVLLGAAVSLAHTLDKGF